MSQITETTGAFGIGKTLRNLARIIRALSKSKANFIRMFQLTLLLITLFVSSTYGATRSSKPSCIITKGIYTSKAESGLKLTFHKIEKQRGWQSNIAIKVSPTVA
jgi:hypothetical protein